MTRLAFWILDRLPMRMRSWICVRRYYWQPEEIAALKARARELAAYWGTE
jgi:hypothetical protein